ncbi:MAG: hypothetical protein K6G16_03790 [Lachnospiraceae bacterium]|nr:hypothetical protein [Lachnospiraceae bacterium]
MDTEGHMETEELRKKLKEYISLVERIRALTAARVEGSTGSDAYAARLRMDYEQISTLGARGREILEETVSPLLSSDASLSAEVLAVMQDFCGELLDPPSGEELDTILLFEISDRLIREFRALGDDDRLVQQLNMQISVCYANVNRTSRLTVSRELPVMYRDAGLAAAEEICRIRADRDRFGRLSDRAKANVLNGGRFYSALWDTWFASPETNRKRYQALVDALHVFEEPFYREQAPDYDWERYHIRCLEHMGQLTERGNRWGFTEEQCGEICGRLEELWALWEADPRRVEEYVPEGHLQLIRYRNAFFAGQITRETYQDKLIALYEKYAGNAYDMYAVQMNLLIPAEFLASLKGQKISSATEALVRRTCDRVIDYVLRSVNTDAFNYLQEYMTGFLQEFIEIPGLMSFLDTCLQSLSALHPPTWIHSIQTARLSRCLCGHLLRLQPAFFIGVNGCGDERAVKAAGKEILADAYYGGLCHDFGKLCMIDTIFVYGRHLLEPERKIIELHPVMGAAMLASYNTTRRYADIARGHQRWFDNTAGYPADFDTSASPAKPFIDIVAVADALDAATDSVGRSYRTSGSRTLEELSAELRDSAGTRYAPAVVEILSRPEVRADIEWLLRDGRDMNYRDAWLQLRDMQEKGRD